MEFHWVSFNFICHTPHFRTISVHYRERKNRKFHGWSMWKYILFYFIISVTCIVCYTKITYFSYQCKLSLSTVTSRDKCETEAICMNTLNPDRASNESNTPKELSKKGCDEKQRQNDIRKSVKLDTTLKLDSYEPTTHSKAK